MTNGFNPQTETITPQRRFDNLSISLDYHTDPDETYPVLLFVPDTNDPNHYHIELDREQAERLRNWLDIYLNRSSEIAVTIDETVLADDDCSGPVCFSVGTVEACQAKDR